MAECMLSTIDNPFDPFTQFDEWRAYDEQLGYHSLSFLARVAWTSDELSEADQQARNEAAIDEIVKYNVSGMHRKIVEGEFKR